MVRVKPVVFVFFAVALEHFPISAFADFALGVQQISGLDGRAAFAPILKSNLLCFGEPLPGR